MKYIRTHLRPHLDNICAFWLLKRYLPAAKDAELGFVPAENRKTVRDDHETVHVGVGSGKYDEHKGDLEDCATTLVWKDIVSQTMHIDDFEERAVQKIVDWTYLEDTGQLGTEERRAFSVPAIIEGYYETHGRDSLAVTMFGFEILDAIVAAQRNEVKTELDWETRVEFDSPYGKSVAVVGSTRGIDAYAYARGFDLVLIVEPGGKYHTIRAAAHTTIDLTPTMEILKKRDPEAEWFFHHSKKMLICGGSHAPHVATSKLSKEELIEILKTA